MRINEKSVADFRHSHLQLPTEVVHPRTTPSPPKVAYRTLAEAVSTPLHTFSKHPQPVFRHLLTPSVSHSEMTSPPRRLVLQSTYACKKCKAVNGQFFGPLSTQNFVNLVTHVYICTGDVLNPEDCEDMFAVDELLSRVAAAEGSSSRRGEQPSS